MNQSRLIQISYQVLKVAFWVLLALGIVILLTGLTSVFRPADQRSGSFSLPLRFTLDEEGSYQSRYESFSVRTNNATVEVSIHRPPTGLLGLLLLQVLIAFGPALWIIALLVGIFARLKQNEFFCEPVVKKTRMIGILLIAITLFKPLLDLITYLFFERKLEIDNMHLIYAPDFSPGLLFTGVMVLVLSGVFAYGKQLKEEQDLTI